MASVPCGVSSWAAAPSTRVAARVSTVGASVWSSASLGNARWGLVVAAVAATIARFGRLDILVNNAGIGLRGGIEATSVEDWDEVMGVNAKGVFLGTKVAIPEMRKVGGGSIINISSQMAMVGSDRSGVAYHASKGAVRTFTKSAAIRHAKEGIRVNSVHPGPVVTPMIEDRLSDETERARLTSLIPLGRIGTPEDVAYGVLYLASDESAFVTGSELVIDGGWIAQ